MAYLTADELQTKLGHPQERVVWGQGVFPAATRVAELIAGAERTIDGYCRARYTVPFSPVPEDISLICLSLCLAELLPAVHTSKDQLERAQFEWKKAIAKLEAIQAGDYSLQDDDDASASGSGGPVIVSAAATERYFSMEDEH